MELKSHVSYVKTLPAGREISYGGTYTTTRETKVATIPVGYGDGYPRTLSNKGSVLIQGKEYRFLAESVWISLWWMLLMCRMLSLEQR